MSNLDDETKEVINKFINNKQEVKAIKYIQDTKGCSLKEAKTIFDNYKWNKSCENISVSNNKDMTNDIKDNENYDSNDSKNYYPHNNVKNTSNNNYGMVKIILIIIVIAGTLMFIFRNSLPKDTSNIPANNSNNNANNLLNDNHKHSDEELQQCAITLVNKKLISPATLQDYKVLDEKEGHYIIYIKITSQNGYGAELFSEWLVYVGDINGNEFKGYCEEASQYGISDADIDRIKSHVDWPGNSTDKTERDTKNE